MPWTPTIPGANSQQTKVNEARRRSQPPRAIRWTTRNREVEMAAQEIPGLPVLTRYNRNFIWCMIMIWVAGTLGKLVRSCLISGSSGATSFLRKKFPIFDGDHPFTLYTDASSKAAGALLAQVQESQEYPIAFYSKGFSQAQCKWASAELELASIVFAVTHFRDYLLRNHFTIMIDNAACVHILKKPTLAPKLQ